MSSKTYFAFGVKNSTTLTFADVTLKTPEEAYCSHLKLFFCLLQVQLCRSSFSSSLVISRIQYMSFKSGYHLDYSLCYTVVHKWCIIYFGLMCFMSTLLEEVDATQKLQWRPVVLKKKKCTPNSKRG